MTRLTTTVVIVLAATLTSPTFGAETLLRCTVKDAVSLDDDGTLSRDHGAAKFFFNTDAYVVDVTTGAVRLCLRADVCNALPSSPWNVAQRGSDLNDTVLVAPGRAGLADFIRIRQWKGQREALFLRYSLSTLVSGTCRPVR